ncbi:hypothetical protein Moror_16917 [Moniliophthora roreri MCA 2997]|uniref:Uncharacterized protein n=2 Tax=Moniliophthora roreri TaxID=221103 RepID=V2X7G7_MONRO|nr:hypothetical protein Moror_16917 [Moniliophthora roreri MCA 2997]KAI3596392.1 hypothetical protein WG66_003092 [Moniliophthora roreri]
MLSLIEPTILLLLLFAAVVLCLCLSRSLRSSPLGADSEEVLGKAVRLVLENKSGLVPGKESTPSQKKSNLSSLRRDTASHVDRSLDENFARHMTDRLIMLLRSGPGVLSPKDRTYFDSVLQIADSKIEDVEQKSEGARHGIETEKQKIEEARQRLNGYQQDLKRHQKSLRFLRLRRRNIQSLYAPIRKLPFEILSIIFIHCTIETNLNSRFSPAILRTLQLVSTYWQRVLLSTPQVWARMRLSWDSAFFSPVSVLERLQLHLKRSRDVPISLHLHIHHAAQPGSWKQFAEYLAAIRGAGAHRLRNLRLVVHDANVSGTSRVLENMKSCIGSVQNFELELGYMYWSEGGTNLLVKLQKACPQLVSLSLSAPLCPVSHITFVSLSFSSLTHLSISLPIETALTAIKLCGANLVSAHVRVMLNHTIDDDEDAAEHLDFDGDEENNNPTRFHVLPSLDTLTIETESECKCKVPDLAIARVLEKISAPSLTRLAILPDTKEQPGKCVCLALALLGLLSRKKSEVPLQSLHIRNFPIDDDGFIAIFMRRLENLKSLVIEEAWYASENRIITECFLKMFTLGIRNKLLLAPNLRYLELEVHSDSDWTPGVFENMLESRIDKGLASVYLKVAEEVSTLNLVRLNRLQQKIALKVWHETEDDEDGEYLISYKDQVFSGLD